MTEDDIRNTLGAMVMALCATMPPALGRRYADALRTCARAQGDAGRTTVETLLRELAQAAQEISDQPREPGPH